MHITGIAEGYDLNLPQWAVVGALLTLGAAAGPVQPINAELAVEVFFSACVSVYLCVCVSVCLCVCLFLSLVLFVSLSLSLFPPPPLPPPPPARALSLSLSLVRALGP